jgi:hypothetical protein
MWFKSKAPVLGDFEQLVLLGVLRLELQGGYSNIKAVETRRTVRGKGSNREAAEEVREEAKLATSLSRPR